MTNSFPLNVIFCGHTGLQKNKIVDRLSTYIFQHDEEWRELSRLTDSKHRIAHEQKLVWSGGIEFRFKPAKLHKANLSDIRRSWEAAFERFVKEQWEKRPGEARYNFLTLHYSFQIYIGCPTANIDVCGVMLQVFGFKDKSAFKGERVLAQLCRREV